MFKDRLADLQAKEDAEDREHKKRESQRLREQAAEAEYNSAWSEVVGACLAGDERPKSTPDLKPFFTLAAVLKTRGYDGWLPKMAENLHGGHHPIVYRRGAYFICDLLLTASRPGATVKQLTKRYVAFRPNREYWRAQAATDVRQFFLLRIHQAPVDAQREAIEQAKTVVQKLASQKRTIRRDLTFLLWKEQGNGQRIGPASIRDRWNRERGGKATSDVVKKGLLSASKFVSAAKDAGVAIATAEFIALLPTS